MAEPIVFANATVVDGTGAAPFPADVRVVGERIDAVGPPGSIPQGRRIDGTGRLLTPGFIDIHSHSDLTLLLDPRASSAIHQGVTLEVIGNCGHGCAPLRDLTLARSAISNPALTINIGAIFLKVSVSPSLSRSPRSKRIWPAAKNRRWV